MTPALAAAALLAAAPPLADWLAREVVGPRQALNDVQEFLDPKLPRVPEFQDAASWERYAAGVRAGMLDKIVFRGGAARWRDLPTKPEVLGPAPAGPGYRVTKLRYEAVPGLWVPAVLYEPQNIPAKAPVHLAVNGHDRNGKAAAYKQARCIHLAKQGVVTLNVEWLNMGQLNVPGNAHYALSQLDLCGTSGVAVFYLAMKRGLDVLLARPYADPARVAVSGLSGGGWQTIFLSSLDTRVTLANPVAGYSGYRTRLRHAKDLGDSEQQPNDMALLADYDHLTALMAPRHLLLTYNGKDNCCFEAGYALPPLVKAAGPTYALLGRPSALRTHVNDVPGDHNFGPDNRRALYAMIRDAFFPGDKAFATDEAVGVDEIRSREDLSVPLPEGNATLHSLALAEMKSLPRDPELPADPAKAAAWQADRREKLRDIVRPGGEMAVKAERAGDAAADGTSAAFWKLRLGGAWTVPAVELSRGPAKGTTVLLHEGGRKAAAADVERALAAGRRVIAVDVLDVGECKTGRPPYDFLMALTLAAAGERSLGIQAAQLAAVCRWAGGPVTLAAVGPRAGFVALAAAAFEGRAIDRVELADPPGSLKDLVAAGKTVQEVPEVFTNFGLLAAFDVRHVAALVAPRPVALRGPSEAARREWAALAGWYKVLGADHDPLK